MSGPAGERDPHMTDIIHLYIVTLPTSLHLTLTTNTLHIALCVSEVLWRCRPVDLADEHVPNTNAPIASDHPAIPNIPDESTNTEYSFPDQTSSILAAVLTSERETSSPSVQVDQLPTPRISRRRRRHSSPQSPDRSQSLGGVSLAAESNEAETEAVDKTGPSADGPDQRPPTKRRRLGEPNMRPDGRGTITTSNGFAGISNGSTPKKVAVSSSINGHSPSQPASNGTGPSQTNGSVKSPSPVRSPTYRGHSREEVTRILIQGLYDMGYNEAAASLSQESHYELESPSVAAFRHAIMDGQWTDAEAILLGSYHGGNEKTSAAPDLMLDGPAGLVLAEGADKSQMLFWMRQQKFLEYLDQRDLSKALTVLRQELTPLNHDIHQLHALSSLLMCPAEDWRAQARWNGSTADSRKQLLQELTKSISPSVMIPEHRLAHLLNQVKRSQINNCLYHNTATPPSLYADHMCERDDFPLRTILELDSHSDEVWYLEFSHDGTKLATASKDRTVIIYETTTFTILHRLTDHEEEVTYITWSPDDSKLISCSKDHKARMWDVSTGCSLLKVDHQTPVSAASWAPDGLSFVTSALEKASPICHWIIDPSDFSANSYTIGGGFRAQDCVISPDGQRLVVVDSEKHLYVFNLHNYVKEYTQAFPAPATCVSISRDSRHILVNLSSGEIQLLDIETGDPIRTFEGQEQGHYIIRSCFGGAAENFVLSGSEDSMIYVWHKENGVLIEKLKGHASCVNAVAWNPSDPGMFASAGDDRRVRIWSNSVSPSEAVPSSDRRPISSNSHTRMSAIRSTFVGGSNL